MDDTCFAAPAPTSARPMLGLTVLLVEDSRYASEAMRLLCLRSGARIRRADCLASARRHLRVYRPSVAIVDLGLPDGSGTDLIADLASATPRIEAVLGLSGDDAAEERAMSAGADDFLSKPLESLAAFQATVLRNLPADRQPPGPRAVTNEVVEPDRIAFHDDMAHLAEVLNEPRRGANLDYVAQFLGGVARSARDDALADAAETLARSRRHGRETGGDVARIARLVQERLGEAAVI